MPQNVILKTQRFLLHLSYQRRWTPLAVLFALSIVGAWFCILFILPWPEHPMRLSMTHPVLSLDEVRFHQKPRVVVYDSFEFTGSTHSSIDYHEEEQVTQQHSEDYDKYRAEPLSDGLCAVPKNADWMLTSFPTCNMFHEGDVINHLIHERTRIKTHGYWRDVWVLPDTSTRSYKQIALKTLRFEHNYTDQNYERHRRDALAYDRLTFSSYVVKIYGYCGQSGFYEYSGYGTLADRLEEHIMATLDAEIRIGGGSSDDSTAKLLDNDQKLKLAYQVALALADVHDTDAIRDSKGRISSAAIVHADIKSDQFINFNGQYKLNDFNRCRFMRRKVTASIHGDDQPCGFRVQRNPSIYRSPEEYSFQEETEKIDIYSMANIFYALLADREPWEGMEENTVQQMIIAGDTPRLPETKVASSDVTLRNLMQQCFTHDPSKRPRARTVANLLAEALGVHGRA
jgi:serine/threonine protein kinase